MANQFLLIVYIFFGTDANPQYAQRVETYQSRDACKLAGIFATGNLRYRLLGSENKPYEVWYQCTDNGAEFIPLS